MSGFGGNAFVLTSADIASGLALPVSASLTKVYANLGTAGSTATTVAVNKNGAAQTGAGVTVAASATQASVGITNPYVGVNAAAGSWTDQNGTLYNKSAGGVNNTPPLATYAAGDVVSLTNALGTSAANLNVTLYFEQN